MVINFGDVSNRRLQAYWSKVLRMLQSEYETTCLPANTNCTAKAFHAWLKKTWGITLLDSVIHYGIAGVEVDDKYMTMLLLRVPA